MEIVLEAGHTHFYPGHEGWLEGDGPSAAGENALPVRIVFSDGAMAGGILSMAEDGGWELEVAPYTTAAGTEIGAKRWSIGFISSPGRRDRFRIERKLSPRED